MHRPGAFITINTVYVESDFERAKKMWYLVNNVISILLTCRFNNRNSNKREKSDCINKIEEDIQLHRIQQQGTKYSGNRSLDTRASSRVTRAAFQLFLRLNFMTTVGFRGD